MKQVETCQKLKEAGNCRKERLTEKKMVPGIVILSNMTCTVLLCTHLNNSFQNFFNSRVITPAKRTLDMGNIIC